MNCYLHLHSYFCDFKVTKYTIFNTLSLIENVGLTYIGGKYLSETEKCLDLIQLTLIVSIVQITGLVIHLVYFYQHPWRKLEKTAYYILEKTLIIIFVGIFMCAMVYLWIYYTTYTNDANDPDLCLNYWKNITLDTFSNYTTNVHLMIPSKVKGRKITTSIIALTVFTVLVGLFVSTMFIFHSWPKSFRKDTTFELGLYRTSLSGPEVRQIFKVWTHQKPDFLLPGRRTLIT